MTCQPGFRFHQPHPFTDAHTSPWHVAMAQQGMRLMMPPKAAPVSGCPHPPLPSPVTPCARAACAAPPLRRPQQPQARSRVQWR
eukprot:358267-Chlamydomonas_euryale.AAC.5